jgi:uncharacterized protein (DUF58 family)
VNLRGLVPTLALPALLGLPLLAAALAVFVPPLRGVAYGLDAALVLVAAVDAVRVLGVGVTVRRVARRTWSVGRPETVRVELEQRSGRRLAVEVHQTVFPGCEAEGLPATIVLGRVGAVSWRAVGRQRGRFALGAHHVRVRSPWGLWQRQLDLPAEDPVHVFPDIKALVEYDLLARAGRQSMLTRSIPRPGNLAEFERMRPYARGDEYRLVDWKATARARQPIVRQLRHATDQNIVFLLDLGRAMTASWEGRSALDAALDALILTGHVALRHHDKVGLIAFDNRVRAVLPPSAGPRARQTLLRTAASLHSSLEEPDYREAFAVLRTRVRARSLVVVLSSVVDDTSADLLARLFGTVSRHLVVWVCLRDPGVEALADAPADGVPDTAWRRGAATEVLEWRRRVLDRARDQGVHVIDALPGEVTPTLLARYLDIKARQTL